MDRLTSLVPKSTFKPVASLISPAKSRTSNDYSYDRGQSVESSPSQDRYRDRPSSRSSQVSEHGYLDMPRSGPLISLSRSPSPFARQRSAHQSEDEDEGDDAVQTYGDTQDRPLLSRAAQTTSQPVRRLWQKGGLGHFLFHTPAGQRTYVGLLVFWLGGCQFGTVLLNRFILWTGTYKFPYPLTMTLFQLVITHILLLGFANLTRLVRHPLQALGLGAMVAPCEPLSDGPQGFRRSQGGHTFWTKLGHALGSGRGGIAGGGLFEFEWKTAKHILPFGIVFIAKLVLSNISYAYAVLPVYQCARVGIIPLSLLFTFLLEKTPHSVQTLSSSLTAVLNLLMASIQPNLRAPWQSIVSGVFSTGFVALYPILLVRTHNALLADMISGDDIQLDADDVDDGAEVIATVTTAPTRAYYTTLHYSSLIFIAMLGPLVLISGEVSQIRRNCYFMDVPWFWFLVFCSSLGGFAVFTSMLLMVLATSPLSATFVAVPRSAFQLAVLNKLRLPPHSWVGVSLCWASCIWYLVTRWREMRNRDGVRPERG